jgi:hypothetical protein
MGIPKSKEKKVKRLQKQLKKHKECPKLLERINNKIKTIESKGNK